MEIKSFNMSNFSQLECPGCNAKIYAEKTAENWYCGHCGKRIELKASEELLKKENELLAKESELRIKEAALKKKEEALKAKEEELRAIEAGEEPVKPSAPDGPTFKVEAPKGDDIVPTLKRPDTIFNSPEMRFNQLSQNKPAPAVAQKAEPTKQTTPAPKAEPQKQTAPAPKAEPQKQTAPAPKAEPQKQTASVVKIEKPVPVSENQSAEHKTEPLPEEHGLVKYARAASHSSASSKSSDGKKKEFELEEHTLVKYNGSYTKVSIPGDVWKIGSMAFRGNPNITAIICDEQVKDIENYAFMYCTALTEVVLPPELKKIKYQTFKGCTNLKSIKIPKSVEEIMNGALVCGLEEITFESPDTQWDTENEFAEASFEVDKNESGKGVRRIIFNGMTYDAADVVKYKTLAGYFKSIGQCQYCGGKFGMLNRCSLCKTKKDY